jgi:hypothetical protein
MPPTYRKLDLKSRHRWLRPSHRRLCINRPSKLSRLTDDCVGERIKCRRFGTLCLFHSSRSVDSSMYPLMKMEETQRFKTLAFKLQMSVNHSEESLLYLKSSWLQSITYFWGSFALLGNKSVLLASHLSMYPDSTASEVDTLSVPYKLYETDVAIHCR